MKNIKQVKHNISENEMSRDSRLGSLIHLTNFLITNECII